MDIKIKLYKKIIMSLKNLIQQRVNDILDAKLPFPLLVLKLRQAYGINRQVASEMCGITYNKLFRIEKAYFADPLTFAEIDGIIHMYGLERQTDLFYKAHDDYIATKKQTCKCPNCNHVFLTSLDRLSRINANGSRFEYNKITSLNHVAPSLDKKTA